MSEYAVVTAVGPDRPGLVDEITGVISRYDLNIEDSRMAVLGGEFAIIMLVSGTSSPVDILAGEEAAIRSTTGLELGVRKTIGPGQREMNPSMPHTLRVTSLDHPGLVHDITRFLHEREINIESMETHVQPAPLSGTPIFTMHAVVSVPVGKKSGTLKQEIRNLEQSLDVDLELEAGVTY